MGSVAHSAHLLSAVFLCLANWLAALASTDLWWGNRALLGIAALKDILAITEDALLAIFLSVEGGEDLEDGVWLEGVN